MKNNELIRSGVYLVVDPSIGNASLIKKVNEVVKGQIIAIQIWDNFNKDQDINELISSLLQICKASKTPLLIENHWKMLKDYQLDGVHFDNIPNDYTDIKNAINRPFISGITCGNDLKVVKWAEMHHFDYISFCSLFQSDTATSCELVKLETIQEASRIFNGKIYVAGGIKPGNMHLLNDINYDGVAVISGIMKADNPLQAISEYNNKLK